MRLASCQNSHWSTVTVSTKGQDEGGTPILNPLLLHCGKATCLPPEGETCEVLDLSNRHVKPTGL